MTAPALRDEAALLETIKAIHEAMRDVNRDIDEALAHPDAKEGVNSFLERRAPQFTRLDGGL